MEDRASCILRCGKRNCDSTCRSKQETRREACGYMSTSQEAGRGFKRNKRTSSLVQTVTRTETFSQGCLRRDSLPTPYVDSVFCSPSKGGKAVALQGCTRLRIDVILHFTRLEVRDASLLHQFFEHPSLYFITSLTTSFHNPPSTQPWLSW